MSKFLCTVDLDGTLLTDDKKIKNKTKKYIKKWIAEGNIFAFSTGRPYTGVMHIYHMLGLDIPLITDNGAGIFFLGEENKFFPIPKDVFQSFMEETKGLDSMFYMTTSKNKGLAHNASLLPRWIIHDECNEYELIDKCRIEDIINYDVLIYNCWIKDEYFLEYQKIVNKYLNNFFYYDWGLDNGYHFIEIHSNNSSKGHALKYLKEYYHIDEDKTIAFGDQMNDMSMLEEAFYGVAMKNSSKEVLSKCKYITKKDNNHNGVIHFLNKNNLK